MISSIFPNKKSTESQSVSVDCKQPNNQILISFFLYLSRRQNMMKSEYDAQESPQSTEPTTTCNNNYYDSDSVKGSTKEEYDEDGELDTRYYIPGKNNGTTFTVAPLTRTCPLCGKVYRVVNELRVHYRRHTGSAPYRCLYPNCKRTVWVDGRKLNKHIRRKHLQIRHHQKSTKDNNANRSKRPIDEEDPVKEWVKVDREVIDAESELLGIGNNINEDRFDKRRIVLKVVHRDEHEDGDEDGEDAKDEDGQQPPFTVIHQTSAGQYICPFEHCDQQANQMISLKNHYREKHAPKRRSCPYRCTFNREECHYAANHMSKVRT